MFEAISKVQDVIGKKQSLQPVARVLSVHLDIRTRWKSTYLMLRRMLKLQISITQFQLYFRRAEGKRNFLTLKTIFPYLTDKKWATIHELCYLFVSFDKAAACLGGDMYPTFVSALVAVL